MAAPSYADFLTRKVDFDTRCGFDVADDEVHPVLKPHQRDIVRWAVKAAAARSSQHSGSASPSCSWRRSGSPSTGKVLALAG